MSEKQRGEAFAYSCLLTSAVSMASSVSAMHEAGTIDPDTALKMIRRIEGDLKYQKPSFLREAEPGNLKEAPWGRPVQPVPLPQPSLCDRLLSWLRNRLKGR